eukprot:CAMPEP_0184484784 /NCGR_PEP_ID=MMETSP0113_2-20130426/6460_1 /TAXON_ID=91329 /ORGANISM="Norrisiella sphaerica, Strain BC52" /LENGTH=1684 /DNA_ID=CAMNT_0026865925 /DNA_START=358 /DNA_END=5412 /DNA_ORIENTATION=+
MDKKVKTGASVVNPPEGIPDHDGVTLISEPQKNKRRKRKPRSSNGNRKQYTSAQDLQDLSRTISRLAILADDIRAKSFASNTTSLSESAGGTLVTPARCLCIHHERGENYKLKLSLCGTWFSPGCRQCGMAKPTHISYIGNFVENPAEEEDIERIGPFVSEAAIDLHTMADALVFKEPWGTRTDMEFLVKDLLGTVKAGAEERGGRAENPSGGILGSHVKLIDEDGNPSNVEQYLDNLVSAGKGMEERLLAAAEGLRIGAMRTQGMRDLRAILRTRGLPRRIEAYDISHMQGFGTVAARSVLVDGVPQTKFYHTHAIQSATIGPGHSDDCGAIAEAVRRRFAPLVRRHAKQNLTLKDGEEPNSGKSAELGAQLFEEDDVLPDAVLIDGGKGQLSAAEGVLRELGLHEKVPLIAIAKREETLHVSQSTTSQPVPPDITESTLEVASRAAKDKDSPLMLLVRLARDEAHAMALLSHRQVRNTAAFQSKLDGIPGVGTGKKAALLSHFAGSVKKIAEATVEELTQVPGISHKAAESVLSHLSPTSSEQSDLKLSKPLPLNFADISMYESSVSALTVVTGRRYFCDTRDSEEDLWDDSSGIASTDRNSSKSVTDLTTNSLTPTPSMYSSVSTSRSSSVMSRKSRERDVSPSVLSRASRRAKAEANRWWGEKQRLGWEGGRFTRKTAKEILSQIAQISNKLRLDSKFERSDKKNLEDCEKDRLTAENQENVIPKESTATRPKPRLLRQALEAIDRASAEASVGFKSQNTSPAPSINHLKSRFKITAPYNATEEQERVVDALAKGIVKDCKPHSVLKGATGTGKTFVMSKIIERVNRPTLVLAPNKVLAAQLYDEFCRFFPKNAVEYFVSYYDFYRPESYKVVGDIFLDKVSKINDDIDRLRHSATRALLERRDVIVVASVSCLYGLGMPKDYIQMSFNVYRNQTWGGGLDKSKGSKDKISEYEITGHGLLRKLGALAYSEAESVLELTRGSYWVGNYTGWERPERNLWFWAPYDSAPTVVTLGFEKNETPRDIETESQPNKEKVTGIFQLHEEGWDAVHGQVEENGSQWVEDPEIKAVLTGQKPIKDLTFSGQPTKVSTASEVEGEINSISDVCRKLSEEVSSIRVYPASHHVLSEREKDRVVNDIIEELEARTKELMAADQRVEARRLRDRTERNVEGIKQKGFCKGIENYSRHLAGRDPGTPPDTLLDYFPAKGHDTSLQAENIGNGDEGATDAKQHERFKDPKLNPGWLLIVDESHVSVPQIRAMYEGDRRRKSTLVKHGFRLPSALDNRPLTGPEFWSRIPQALYVSATPGAEELRRCGLVPHTTTNEEDRGREKGSGVAYPVEMVLRPTGIPDPRIEVRKLEGHIDDLMEEVSAAKNRHERVLITVVTKRLAEGLAGFLTERGMKAAWLHSDVKPMERLKVLGDLRSGIVDVIVGVNLLREGLDLPEVALVIICDADKEGFLRCDRSLIQTIGRAARHVNGRVLMYADVITGSMQRAISETARRRRIQLHHNQINQIIPRPLQRPHHRNVLLDVISGSHAQETRETSGMQKRDGSSAISSAKQKKKFGKRTPDAKGKDAETGSKAKLGFKNREIAEGTISIVEETRPLNKRAPTIALLLRRALRHPHQTQGMRDAVEVFEKWITEHRKRQAAKKAKEKEEKKQARAERKLAKEAEKRRRKEAEL